MEYNGWATWETWNVALWAENAEGAYRARLNTYPTGAWTAARARDFCEEFWPGGTPDMDETDSGYGAVDWDEIADTWNGEE